MVLGDGKVFSGRPEPLAVPDQEAILGFRNGVETLAIRTRVDVPGTPAAMAWVVPVPGPAAPTVGATSDGTFVSADRLLSTRFIDRVSNGPGLAAVAYGLVAVLSVLGLRAATPSTMSRAARVVCLTLYFGFAFLIATCVSLPTLSTSRSSGPVVEGVQVLTSQRVGTLDVTVLKAGDDASSAAALRAWLTAHGCVVSADADAVIRDYAAAG
jgi:hypothetical protein